MELEGFPKGSLPVGTAGLVAVHVVQDPTNRGAHGPASGVIVQTCRSKGRLWDVGSRRCS